MTSQELSIEESKKLVDSLRAEIGKEIFGQQKLVEEALACFLAGGHLLMTGAPGLAKTTLVRVISKSLGLSFGRIQFTPDLLPSDITGSEILNFDDENQKRHFEFAKGPVFTNLLLADEINRASPRTQSAMLESMQERKVTANGKEYILPQPFMVFATQNPYESEGTFPLPEAQLDRFLLHSMVDYPEEATEMEILRAHVENKLVGEKQIEIDDSKQTTLSEEQIKRLMTKAKSVSVSEEILQLVSHFVRSTRPSDELCPEELKGAFIYGAGPRAGISMISTAKAFALIQGRSEVLWRDIKRIATPALRHRIALNAAARRDGLSEESIIHSLMEAIEKKYSQLALS